MKEKKNKYDTNPLEPDYARQADDEWGAKRTKETAQEVKERWDAESPTKRYDASIPVSYPSVHVPPSYPPREAGPAAKQQASKLVATSDRTVPGLGLPENWTYALPYAPFFIGAVAAGAELFLTPRTETKARFHAAQGLALHAAALAITFIFNMVGNITGSNVGGKLFWAASTVFFIVSLIRVLKGEALHVPAVEGAAAWLEGHIEPQKKKD